MSFMNQQELYLPNNVEQSARFDKKPALGADGDVIESNFTVVDKQQCGKNLAAGRHGNAAALRGIPKRPYERLISSEDTPAAP